MKGFPLTNCPRCGEKKLVVVPLALNCLSRRDNKTYICTRCGTEEALNDYSNTWNDVHDWVSPPPSIVALQ